jgi:dCTP deaminase
MVVNGKALYALQPLDPMFDCKMRDDQGVSYGLAEVGYDVRLKQEIALSPNHRFCLASTIEKFNMPNNLMGIVHDKSTWARRGLSVFNTVIEPGWRGWLTLELVFHGTDTLYLPQGCGIAQIIFHEIKEPMNYTGSYQDQADKPVPSITQL